MLNFVGIFFLAWIALLATTTSAVDSLMAPTLHKHRILTHALESLVVTVVMCIIPITILAYAIPVMMMVTFVAYRYRNKIKKFIHDPNLDNSVFEDKGNKIDFYSKDMSVGTLQRHYAVLSVSSNTFIVMFAIMGVALVFSIVMHR